MSNYTIIIGGGMVWLVFGILFYDIFNMFYSDKNFSWPQLIVARIIAGPCVWLISLWQILGLIGKRSK